MDFCSYLKQDILMMKDRVSGMIWGRITRNKTSKEAFAAVMEWSYRVGLPYEVRSDGAGSFRSSFSNLLKEVGINYVHTSPYNSKSKVGWRGEECLQHQGRPEERKYQEGDTAEAG